MKDLAILMYVKGNASYGMIGRILGVSNVSVYRWIKKEAIRLGTLSIPSEISDVQIDEMLMVKKNKLWICKAYDVRSKRTIKCVLGNRDDSTCKELIDRLGKRIKTYMTDNWEAYNKLIPMNRHIIGKKYTK